MTPEIVRVTVFRPRDEPLDGDENLITHKIQAQIIEVLIERGIGGVHVEHLNWMNGARAYIDGPPDMVDQAWKVMRTDPRLAPYFSKMVIEWAPRAPSPNDAGWKNR